MQKLDEKVLRLIAIGASISANCQPCLQINIDRAAACGIEAGEIAEAIEIGKMVRRGAATKMDKLAASLGKGLEEPASQTREGCGCEAQPTTEMTPGF
jgi:alkylhydroperoxidase/carboxymuconolactone decarboxylase family protein YurZ